MATWIVQSIGLELAPAFAFGTAPELGLELAFGNAPELGLELAFGNAPELGLELACGNPIELACGMEHPPIGARPPPGMN